MLFGSFPLRRNLKSSRMPRSCLVMQSSTRSSSVDLLDDEVATNLLSKLWCELVVKALESFSAVARASTFHGEPPSSHELDLSVRDDSAIRLGDLFFRSPIENLAVKSHCELSQLKVMRGFACSGKSFRDKATSRSFVATESEDRGRDR